MSSWVEEDVEAGVRIAMFKSLISVPEDRSDDVEIAVGIISAEVIEWEAKQPETEDDVRTRLEDIIDVITDLSCEEDEISSLITELHGLISDLNGEEVDEREDLLSGECEMCEREAPITRHHVHPLKVHDYAINHLGRTKKECHFTIGICRPCHNMVHKLADHKTLAEKFNTTEKILADPSIYKFVCWAKNQKVKGI
eukprot:TRINITY_DN443_c0_g1_i1.p1 TRINITY_DN443_c0_g1~~TRINITY_DN443_c0_g1_i1.p1  ORF type:complete len:213 (+),score=53.75 TRINITY_DN443_c0_g1_i1:49-639(+)